MTRTKVLAVVLTLLALALATFHVVRAAPRLRVTTAPVTLGRIERQILTTGTLQAITTVEIGTQISGTVGTLGADYNSIVRKGQVLARLDPAAYEATLEGAKAALAQSQADLDVARTAVTDAETKLARARDLSTQDLIPATDLSDAIVARDTAVATARDLEAQVAQAQAGVQQAAVNLNHTIIRSPCDGIVIARNVDLGQTVAAAVQAPVLFVVAADLTTMQLQATIDEADVGAVRAGDEATFDVDAYPNDSFRGTVATVRLEPLDESIGQTASPNPAAPSPPTGTVVAYDAIINVRNPDEKLRPGMTATIMMRGLRKDGVIRIPNNALSFHPSQDVLEAIGEREPAPGARSTSASDAPVTEVWEYDGKRFTPIAVRTGLADSGWTELVGGPVRSGDALVTSAVRQ